jgi:hypothetical protein
MAGPIVSAERGGNYGAGPNCGGGITSHEWDEGRFPAGPVES